VWNKASNGNSQQKLATAWMQERSAQFQYKKIELNPMANERKKLSLKSM